MTDSEPCDELPRLHALHERHYGITPSQAGVFSESFQAIMEDFHTPPVEFEIHDNDSIVCRRATWETADERIDAAYDNDLNATEDAAYGISASVVEVVRGLCVVRRAPQGSGADYFLSPIGTMPGD
jgi:hypothetical protein